MPYVHYPNLNKNEHELDELIRELGKDKRLSYLTWKISKGMNNEFYKKFGFNYDPVPDFQKITIPVLCIWGELDKIVPAQGSRLIIDKALSKAGNLDYTLKIFANDTSNNVQTKNVDFSIRKDYGNASFISQYGITWFFENP